MTLHCNEIILCQLTLKNKYKLSNYESAYLFWERHVALILATVLVHAHPIP